jgi:hypothetical protein
VLKRETLLELARRCARNEEGPTTADTTAMNEDPNGEKQTSRGED